MSQPPIDARKRLEFVCDMLDQLMALVPTQVGPLLPHLISMARLEAAELLSSIGPEKN
jgi:hypothetical protein